MKPTQSQLDDAFRIAVEVAENPRVIDPGRRIAWALAVALKQSGDVAGELPELPEKSGRFDA